MCPVARRACRRCSRRRWHRTRSAAGRTGWKWPGGWNSARMPKPGRCFSRQEESCRSLAAVYRVDYFCGGRSAERAGRCLQLRPQPFGNRRQARTARTRFSTHASGDQRRGLSGRRGPLLVSRVFRLSKVCVGSRPAACGADQPLRRRGLEMGRLIALISIVEWSIAACVYPISLRLVRADMPAAAMLRFFFSLLFCGLVAAAYPFFVVTFFSLHSLYPVFVLTDYEGASSDAALAASESVKLRLSGRRRVRSVFGDHRADCGQPDQRQCASSGRGAIDGRLQRDRRTRPAVAVLAVAFDPDRRGHAVGRDFVRLALRLARCVLASRRPARGQRFFRLTRKFPRFCVSQGGSSFAWASVMNNGSRRGRTGGTVQPQLPLFRGVNHVSQDRHDCCADRGFRLDALCRQ